jgi:hypothetical protein
MTAVFQQDESVAEETAAIGSWRANVRYTKDFLPKGYAPGAILIQTGEEEFIVAGQGVNLGFWTQAEGLPRTDLLSVEMGRFEKGLFVPELRLNGDETSAGYRARIPPDPGNLFLDPSKPRILRVRLYRHK